jgi:hypothetical protein
MQSNTTEMCWMMQSDEETQERGAGDSGIGNSRDGLSLSLSMAAALALRCLAPSSQPSLIGPLTFPTLRSQ